MARFLKKNDQKAGMPPGSLIFTGQHKISEAQIRITSYDTSELNDIFIKEYTPIQDHKDNTKIVWLNIDGVHDSELIKKIGDNFCLSLMALEDIQDTGQRPSIEEFHDHIFATMKILSTDNDESIVKAEQISFVLGSNYLISFQEQPSLLLNRSAKDYPNQTVNSGKKARTISFIHLLTVF